jgi:hypothetical protein
VANQTIVEALIFKLGLDPKDFSKGSKQAAQDLVDLKNKAKDVGEETEKATEKGGSSLFRFASRAAIAAKAIALVKEGIGAIIDSAKLTRDLANSAQLLDTSATKLRNFDNVAEMFGGTVGEARKTVEGLHKAIFNLTFNGQMSEQLVMLGRLGVRFQDASGHMREFKDIYLDTAEKISQARASGKMTEGEALEYLRSTGFDDGLARAALGGKTAAAVAYDQATYVRQLTPEDVAAAQRVEQSRARRRQAGEATSVVGMEKTEETFNTINDVKSAVYEDAANGFPAVRDRISGISNSISEMTRRAQGGLVRGLRNNNPGNLRATSANQPQDADGFRTFTSMDEGIAAANNQLNIYAHRDGINTISGIVSKWAPKNENDTAAYIASVNQQTGISTPTNSCPRADRASVLAAMFRHETNSLAPDAASVADALSLRGSPVDVGATAAAGRGAAASNVTSVQIDEVNVHTQATDGAGIANDIGVDLRKAIAPHAEQSMQ